MDPGGQHQLDKKQLLQQQLLLQKQLQQQQQKILPQQSQQLQQSQVQPQSQQQQQLLQTQPQLQQQKQSLLTQQVLQQEHLKQQQLILGSQQTQLKDNNDEKDIQKQLQVAQQRPHLIHQQQLHLQQQHRQQQDQQQQLQELQQKLLQPQQQSQLVQQIQQQSQFVQQTQQQQQPIQSQFVQKVQQMQINQPQSLQQSQLVQQTQLQQSQLIHQTQQQHSQDLQESHVVQNTHVIKQRQIAQKPTVVQQSQIIQQPQNVQQSHVIQKTQQQQQQIQYATVSTQQKIKLQPPHSQQQLQQQLQQLLSKNKNYPQRIVVLGSQPPQQPQQLVTQQQQQMVMQQQKQMGTQHQQQIVIQQQQQLQHMGTQQQQQCVTQQQSASQQSQCVVTNPTSQQQQILPQQMQCLVVTGTGQQQMQRVVITSTGQQQQQQQIHRVVAGTGKQQQQMQRVVVGASGQQDVNQVQHVVVQGTSQHQTQPMQNIVNAGAIQHQTRQMQCVVVTSASGQPQQQLVQQLQPAAQRLVVCQPKQSHQIHQIQSSSQCGAILGQPLHQDIKQPMTVAQQQHQVSIAGQKQLSNLPVHQQKSSQQLLHQPLQPKPQQVVEQLQQKQQVIQQKQQPQRVVITQHQQNKVNISDQSLLQEIHIKQSHQQLQQLHIQPSQKPLQEQQLNMHQQQPQKQKQQKEQLEQLNRSGVIVGQLQPPARPEPEKMQQQHRLQQLQRQKLQEHLVQQHLRWQQQQQQHQQKQVHDQQLKQKNHQQQLREKVLLKQHLKYQQQQQLQQQLLLRQQVLSENRVSFVISNNNEQKQQDDKKTINQTENTPVPKPLQHAIKIIPEEQIKLDVKRQVDRVAINEENLVLLSSSSDEDEDDDTIRKQRNILLEAKRLVHERHDALSVALGPKCQGHYDKILKQWLDGQLSRDEFDIEIRKVLHMPSVLTTITENNDLNKNDAPVITIDNSTTNMKTTSTTKKGTISIATTSKSMIKEKKDAKKNIKNHSSILAERMPFHNALVTSLMEWMPLNCQWMERRKARARGVNETGCPLRLYTYADVPQTRGATNHWYSEEPGSLVRWYWPDRLPYSSSPSKINDEKQLLLTVFQGKRKMEEVNSRTAAVSLRPPSRTWLPLMLRIATDTEAEQGDRWLKENPTMLKEDVIKRLQWQRLKAKKQLFTMVRLRDGHTKLLHELKIRSRELENEEHQLVECLCKLQMRITKRRRQMLALYKIRLLELQSRIRRYFDRSWQEQPEYQARRRLLIEATKTIENEVTDEENDEDDDCHSSFLKHLEKLQLMEKNREKQEQMLKTKTTTSTLQLSYRDWWPQSSALKLRLLRDRQRYRKNYRSLKIIRKERLLVINHTDRVRELRHKHCPCGESNDQPCRYQNQMRLFRKQLRERELDAIEAENNRKLAEEVAKKELAEESKKLADALIENDKIESKKIQVNATKVVSRKRKAKTVKNRPNKKKAISKVKVEKIVVTADSIAVDDSSTKKSITTNTKTKSNTKTTNTICSPIATTKISTVGTIVPQTSDIVSSVVPVEINCKLYRSERLPPNVSGNSGIQAQKDKKKRSLSVVAAATRTAQSALASSHPIQQRRSKTLPVAVAETTAITPNQSVDENERLASELMPPPPPPKLVATRKPSIGSRYLQQRQLLLDRQRQLMRMRKVEKERQRVYDEHLKQQRNDHNGKEENNKETENVSGVSSSYLLSSQRTQHRRRRGTSAIIRHDLGLKFNNIGQKEFGCLDRNKIRGECELKHKQRYLRMCQVNKLKQKIQEETCEPSTSTSSTPFITTISTVARNTVSPHRIKSSTVKRKKLCKQLQTELSKQPSKSDQKITSKNRQSSKKIRTKYKNKLINVEEKQKQLQCRLQLNAEPNLEHKPTELKVKEILDIKKLMIPPVTNNNQQSIYVCNSRLQEKCTSKFIIPTEPLTLEGKDELEITTDKNKLQFLQGKAPVTQQPNIYKVDVYQERSLKEEEDKKSSKVIKHAKLCENQDKIVKIQLVDKYRKLHSEIVLQKRNCIEMNSLITKYLKLVENLLPEKRLQHLVSLQQQLKPTISIENVTDDLKSSVYQNLEKDPLSSLIDEEKQIRNLLSQIRYKHEKIHQCIEVFGNDVRCAKEHIKYIQNVATKEDKSIDDVGPTNDRQHLGFNSELNNCDTRYVQKCGQQFQEQKQRIGQYERKHLERGKIECQQLRNNKNTKLELRERQKKNYTKKNQLENQKHLTQLNRYKQIKQLEQRKQLLVKRRQQEQQKHQERLKQLLERQQEQLRPKCHWMIRKSPIYPKPYFDELLPLREQLMRKIIENKNSGQLLEIEQQQQQVMRTTRNIMKRGSRYWWTKIGFKRQISPLVFNIDKLLDHKLVVTMPIAHQSQFTRPQMGAIAATVIVKNRKPITPSLLSFTEKKNLKKLLSPQLIQLMTKAEGKCLEELQTKFVDLNRRVDLHWKAMMGKQQQQVQVLLQYEKQKQEKLKLENRKKLHEVKTPQQLEKQKQIQEDKIRQELERQNRLQEEIKRKEIEKQKEVEQQTQQREQYVKRRNELIKQHNPIVFLENLELQQNNMLYKNAQENMLRKQHMDQQNKLLTIQQPVIVLKKLKYEKHLPGKFAEKQKEKVIQQQPSVLAKDAIQQQNKTVVNQKQSEPVENKINLPRMENKIVTLMIVAEPMRDVSKIWRELESMRIAHQTRWKMRLRQLFEIKWINKTFARELYDRLIRLHNSGKRKQKKPKAIPSLKLLQHQPLKPAERQQLLQKIELQKKLIQQQKSSVQNRPIQKRKIHEQQQRPPKNSPVELKSSRSMPRKQQEKQPRKVVSINNHKLRNKKLAHVIKPIQTKKKQGQQKSKIEQQIRQNQQYLDHQMEHKQKHNSLPKPSMVASSPNVQPKPQNRLNLQRLRSSVSTIADAQKKSPQEECNTSIKWILRKLTFLLHNQRIVLERQLHRLNNMLNIQKEPSATQTSILHTYTTSIILTPTTAKQQLSISPVMQTLHSQPEKQQSKQCQVLKERLSLVLKQLKPLMELWQLSLRFPGHWLDQQLDGIEQIQREELKGRKRNRNDGRVVPTATVKKQRSWQQLQRIREYLEWRQHRITELLSELTVVMHQEQHRVLSKLKGLQIIQPASVYSVLLKLQKPLSQIQQSSTYTVVLNLKQPLASKSESLTYSALLSLQIPSTTNQDSLKYSALLKLLQPSKSKQISSNNSGLLIPHNFMMPKKQFSMILTPQPSLIPIHKSNTSVLNTPKLTSKDKFSVTPALQTDKPSVSSLSEICFVENESNQRQRSMSKKRSISTSKPIRSKKLRRLRSKHHCTKIQNDTINGEITNRRQHETSIRKRKVRRRRQLVRTVTVDTHGPAVPTFRDHGFLDGSMEQVVHGRFVATLMTMTAATSIASSVRPKQPSIPVECAIAKDNSNGPRKVSDNDNNGQCDKVTVSTNTPVKLSSIMDFLEKANESHTNSGYHNTHICNGCARTAGTTLVTVANLAKKQMTNEPLSTMRKSRLTASKTKLVTDKNPASTAFMAKPSSSLLQTATLDKISKSEMESIGAGNTGKLSSKRLNKRSASVAFSSLTSSSNMITALEPNSSKYVTAQPHKRSKSAVTTTTASNSEKVFPSSKISVMSELISSSNAVVIESPNRSKLAVPTTVTMTSSLITPPFARQTGMKITHATTPIETVSTAPTETKTTKITHDSDNVNEMIKTITEEDLRTVTVKRTLCPTVPAPMDVSADACSLVASTCEKFIRAMVMERLTKAGHGAGTAELRRRDLYAAAMATDDDVRPVPEFSHITTLASDRPMADTSNHSKLKQQCSPQFMSTNVLNKSTVMTVETVVDTQTTTTTTVSITTVGDKQRSTVTSVSGSKTKLSPTMTDSVTETSARTRGMVAWKTMRKRTEDGQQSGEISSVGKPGFLVERGRPLLRPEFHRRRPFGTLAVTCAMAAAKTTAVNDAAYTCLGDHSDGELGNGGREDYNSSGHYFGDPKLLPPVSRLNRYLVDDDSVTVLGGSSDGNYNNNDEHHRILSKMSTRTGWQQRHQWLAVGGPERCNDVRLEEEEALLARHQQRLMYEISCQQQQRKRLEHELKQRDLELLNRVPDSEEEHYRKFLCLEYGSSSTNAPPSTPRTKVNDDGHDLISW